MAKKGNGKNGGGKPKPKRQSSPEFRRGYAAGYDQGLSECGPMAGVTRYFERGRKRGKIAAGHAAAKQKAVEEAATRHEARRAAESREAREALAAMGNPHGEVHERTTDIGHVLAEAAHEGGFHHGAAFTAEVRALARAKLLKKGRKYRDKYIGEVQVYHLTAKGQQVLHEQYPEAARLARQPDPDPAVEKLYQAGKHRGLADNPRAAKDLWMQRAIKRPGKLGGKGFLSKPRETQKKILAKCERKYGYRSCLGSIQFLSNVPDTRKKYGRTLKSLRKWLVKSYGGPGSFGPRKPGRLLEERRPRALNPRRGGEFLLIPEISDCPACTIKTNPAFEKQLADESADAIVGTIGEAARPGWREDDYEHHTRKISKALQGRKKDNPDTRAILRRAMRGT